MLQDLYLDGNELGDEAGKAIAAALEKNTSLTGLDLRYTGLGDDVGKAIAQALEKK